MSENTVSFRLLPVSMNKKGCKVSLHDIFRSPFSPFWKFLCNIRVFPPVCCKAQGAFRIDAGLYEVIV